jgi:hypothetical protein
VLFLLPMLSCLWPAMRIHPTSRRTPIVFLFALLHSPKYEKEFGCRKQLMDEKYPSKHPIRKDSDTWKLLLEQNRFDVHLYDFAKELFSQQSYIFGL